MANFDPSVRAAIHAVLVDAAADVGLTIDEGRIWKRSEINRADWQSLVKGDSLQPPYVIENVGIRTEDPFGIHIPIYRFACDWHLIFSANDPLANDDPETFAAKWAHALQERLFHYTGDVFGCPERPSADCTDENPANEVFYLSGHRLYAARVIASIRAGDTG